MTTWAWARTLAATLVILALLPGVAFAAAPAARAAQDAPVDLAGPPGPDSGGPPACRPSRTRLCGDGELTPAAAARRLLATLSRRGLGFRSGAALVGRGPARRADRTFAAALGAPAKPAARTAQTAAPTIADAVEKRTSIKRGKAREQRRFAWRAKIERCPDPGRPDNTHGRAKLQAGALLEVVHDEPRRDAIVRTITRMDTKLDTSAASDNRARLDFVGDFRANDVTVTQQVVVIRNGSSRRAGRTAVIEMTADTFSPDVGVKLKSEDLDAFVDQMQAQERGEPAPDTDGPIVGPAWKRVVRDFMQLVAARAREVAGLAETHWRTPNRCFGFKLDGPSKLRPGARSELTGKPSPGERGGTPRSILGTGGGSGTWTTARVPKGKSLESLVSGLPLPEDKPWIAFVAPDKSWKKGAEPTVEMTFASKAGIASTTKVFEEGLPDRFAGTVTSAITSLAGTITFTSRLEYALKTDVVNPDGSRSAVYDLKTGELTAFVDQSDFPCKPRGTTSGAAIVRFGDLELSITPGGEITYGFVQDLGREGVPYVPQEVGPGCETSTQLAVAFLNARTGTNALRPAPADLRLIQAPTNDVFTIAATGATGTASWELLPG